MPDCGVHYLWFAFVCFLMSPPPPPTHAQWCLYLINDVERLLVAGMPLLIERYIRYYFSFVVSGKTKLHPIVLIQNAQNETGKSKMPPKWKKFLSPPPPPSGPAHTMGVGV